VDSPSILIVEDEPEIADLVRFHLQREGMLASVVHSGRAALAAVESAPPRLILLDLMLPDLDGLEVCRRVKYRETTRDIPIIIVSAKGEEADVVTGLELGAEDYITKPFSPRVLLARVKRVLRRPVETATQSAVSNHTTSIADGALQIDTDRHSVMVNGESVELTVTEFGILEYLAAKPGFVRTRDQIISKVHGHDTVLSSRTVDVHVTALRKKLGELGPLLQTVRGVGYRLNEALAPAGA
jgi:two-component system, OmpR family, alkaline phosphatase synthesis response regulator PhoP